MLGGDTHSSHFFSNSEEKNLLIVKKKIKCRENGIACLRKGKLRRRSSSSALPWKGMEKKPLEHKLH